MHLIYFLLFSLNLFNTPKNESGSFNLVIGDSMEKISLSEASGNHIFAKKYDNYLWVRLALSPDEDGESSNHLDIDIWNYAGPGTYSAANPKASQRDGKKWNIWWHQEGKVYMNQEDSSPCQLVLSQVGDKLKGSFNCHALKLNNSTETISIEKGNFDLIPIDGKTN